MITRHEAENQANACLAYNAGGFVVSAIGLALSGSRAAVPVTSICGIGVALHALLLYGVPETRETILRWTASGMEDRRRLQSDFAQNVETALPG